jgi:hypothetical protein
MTVLPKKILTIALLLIVAVPLFFAVTYVFQQKHIQNQMKEKLEQASLQNVNIPVNALTWVKKNKEALINGKLFDVKEIFISGNTITLKGLFDDAEDQLTAKMRDMIRHKKDAGPISGQATCIFLPLYSENPDFSLQTNFSIVTFNFCSYRSYTSEGHYFTAAPPPKFS